MNWIRKQVSGKRNRLKEGEYNLDITYITDRILAMSYPATGFESMYRNSISDVARFLEERHSEHYRVYNLSNRVYNPEKFNGAYRFYEWEDHHSPPIEMLFEICLDMHKYLQGNTLS
jgi:phosphatidylinositol-3,4,5-trisphosphate 3-phosphatase/dual-specificity protein phosphatase PTEN